LKTRKTGSEPISPARRKPAPLPHSRNQPSASRKTWYFNTKDWLAHLSQLTGLDYYEQHRVFGHKSGALIGSLDGYLACIGLGRSDNGRNTAVRLVLRYGKSDDTARIEQCINLAKGHFKTIKVSATSVVATRIYVFRKPTPESVAEDLTRLITILKSIVHPLNGRCEECHRTEPNITLVNRVPRHLCESCKNQLRQQLGVAAAEYAGIKSNLPRGIFYGTGVAVIGAVGWCVLASTLNRIFVYVAVAIGLLVGKAVIMGIGKVSLSARLLTGTLTLASVFLGDVFFYTFDLMRVTSGTSGAGLSFGQAFQSILGNLGTVMADNGGVASIIFALVGAGFIVVKMRTPKFEPVFESVAPNQTKP